MQANEVMARLADLIKQRDALNRQAKILNRLGHTIETNQQAIDQATAILDTLDDIPNEAAVYADYYQLKQKDYQLVTRYNKLVDELNTQCEQYQHELAVVNHDMEWLLASHQSIDYLSLTSEQRRLISKAFAEIKP